MHQNPMDRCALVSFKTLLVAFLLLSLSGCSGGGDGGGGGTPVAAPPATIVAGSVQAPAGQIAFFREKGLSDVFVSEAYAALSGLANVPDNTIIQLARLNSDAITFTVL